MPLDLRKIWRGDPQRRRDASRTEPEPVSAQHDRGELLGDLAPDAMVTSSHRRSPYPEFRRANPHLGS